MITVIVIIVMMIMVMTKWCRARHLPTFVIFHDYGCDDQGYNHDQNDKEDLKIENGNNSLHNYLSSWKGTSKNLNVIHGYTSAVGLI